jgi:uncharacterized membrane protein YheB (UPF0754 family)
MVQGNGGYLIYFTPVISGFIGWITNYIAVKMIFRPREPINLFGLKIIGLVPKRKADLARKIGETVEKELISHKDIHAAVNTPEFHEHLLNAIMQAIDLFVSQKVGSGSLASLVLGGDFVRQIKETIKTEVGLMVPGFMENMFEKMEEKIDFKEIVRRKIEDFDFEKLEKIIYAIASKELKAIELLGGILGFVIGLVQVLFIVNGF